MTEAGLIFIGIGILLLVGGSIELILRRWRWRWVIGTVVLGAVAIAGALAVATLQQPDSDAWFLGGMIIFGGTALLISLTGSAHTGKDVGNISSPRFLKWRHLLPVAAVALLSGSLLVSIAEETKSVVWLTVVGLLPLSVPIAAFLYSRGKQLFLRSLMMFSAVGTLLVSWILVSFGAHRWTLLASSFAVLLSVMACEWSLVRTRSD
jgi:hypothetical protein